MLLLATYRLLEQRNQRIGVPGRVVEIDECLLHRRKYKRGRVKESGWVVGGIERPRTPKETLQSLIHKWVVPGTLILTDSFSSYRGLEDSGEYRYRTVNHSKEFVATDLTNTQRIEGIWHWIRVHALPPSGAKLEDVDLHLAAFLYRRYIDNSIVQFIKDLGTLNKSDILAIKAERSTKRTHAEKQLQAMPEPRAETTEAPPGEVPSQTITDQMLRETFISSPRHWRNRLPPIGPPSEIHLATQKKLPEFHLPMDSQSDSESDEESNEREESNNIPAKMGVNVRHHAIARELERLKADQKRFKSDSETSSTPTEEENESEDSSNSDGSNEAV